MRKAKVIPMRGARGLGDADVTGESAPAAAAQPQQTLSVTDVLQQIETGIIYSQQAAARTVQYVPAGVEGSAVQDLLGSFPTVQQKLITARDALKSAPTGSDAQTAALEQASEALKSLNSYLGNTEDLIQKTAPTAGAATLVKTQSRAKLIWFGSIGAALALGIGIWVMARKKRSRGMRSGTRLKLKAVPA